MGIWSRHVLGEREWSNIFSRLRNALSYFISNFHHKKSEYQSWVISHNKAKLTCFWNVSFMVQCCVWPCNVNGPFAIKFLAFALRYAQRAHNTCEHSDLLRYIIYHRVQPHKPSCVCFQLSEHSAAVAEQFFGFLTDLLLRTAPSHIIPSGTPIFLRGTRIVSEISLRDFNWHTQTICPRQISTSLNFLLLSFMGKIVCVKEKIIDRSIAQHPIVAGISSRYLQVNRSFKTLCHHISKVLFAVERSISNTLDNFSAEMSSH